MFFLGFDLFFYQQTHFHMRFILFYRYLSKSLAHKQQTDMETNQNVNRKTKEQKHSQNSKQSKQRSATNFTHLKSVFTTFILTDAFHFFTSFGLILIYSKTPTSFHTPNIKHRRWYSYTHAHIYIYLFIVSSICLLSRGVLFYSVLFLFVVDVIWLSVVIMMKWIICDNPEYKFAYKQNRNNHIINTAR